MPSRVGIIGAWQTQFEASKAHQTISEMVFEITQKVIQNAGISWKDLDYTITSSIDLWDGGTATNATLTEVVGAVMKPEMRVAGDGLTAAFQGLLTILSGAAELVLVVSYSKESMGPGWGITNWVFDPIYQQMLGLDYLSAAALQARAFFSRYGVTEEDCARVVVKNLAAAQGNPFTQRGEKISVEKVMASEVWASPIKALDVAPLSDGGCAVILASEKVIRERGVEPIWILGAGRCLENHYLGERDLAEGEALHQAAQKAYGFAGIKNPGEEIDVAEISCAFSYQEILWSELLGFYPRGQGTRLLEEWEEGLDGKLSINPSGGMMAGNPLIPAGLVRLVEAFLQIKGKAQGHQVSRVKKALAHGTDGPCGQGQCVMVIGV
jgi:acetyl-CoA C-acetyltransferase